MALCWNSQNSSFTQSVQEDLNGPPGQSLQIFLWIDKVLRAQKIYLWYCCTITLVIKNYIICYYKAIFRWCVTMFVTCVCHKCSSHMFIKNFFVHTYTKIRHKLKTVSKLWQTLSQTLCTLPTELQKFIDYGRHKNIIFHYYRRTSYISTADTTNNSCLSKLLSLSSIWNVTDRQTDYPY